VRHRNGYGHFTRPDDFDDTATITAYEMVQHGGQEYRRADLPPTLSADLIRLRAEVATLRASEARMREALEMADRALKPFADTVFNDNGDCTISDTYLLTDVDFCNAYSARNIARAALQGETK
jgi:hypothetical protein